MTSGIGRHVRREPSRERLAEDLLVGSERGRRRHGRRWRRPYGTSSWFPSLFGLCFVVSLAIFSGAPFVSATIAQETSLQSLLERDLERDAALEGTFDRIAHEGAREVVRAWAAERLKGG